MLFVFSMASSISDCGFHLLTSCLVELKKIPDVAMTKGVAHQFIFLLLVVKHGRTDRTDIWLVCGSWAEGRKIESGEGKVMKS